MEREDMNSLALTVLKASRRAVCLITDQIWSWETELDKKSSANSACCTMLRKQHVRTISGKVAQVEIQSKTIYSPLKLFFWNFTSIKSIFIFKEARWRQFKFSWLLLYSWGHDGWKAPHVHNYNLWICDRYYSLLSGVCVTMCFMIYQLVFTPLPWFLNIKFYQL